MNPFTISMEKIAYALKTLYPRKEILGNAVGQQGYELYPSYLDDGQWKSNAPVGLFFDLVREWKKVISKHSEAEYFKNTEPGSPAHKCLNKPSKYISLLSLLI